MFVPFLLATPIAAIFAYMNSSGANSAKHTEKTVVRHWAKTAATDQKDRSSRCASWRKMESAIGPLSITFAYPQPQLVSALFTLTSLELAINISIAVLFK